MDIVLMMIGSCCKADRDVEMKIDMLILLSFLISASDLAECLKAHSETIVKVVLFIFLCLLVVLGGFDQCNHVEARKAPSQDKKGSSDLHD